MYRPNIYRKYHVRSLFISKFLTTNQDSLGQLTHGDLVLIAPADDYSIVNLFLFLITKRWPRLRLNATGGHSYFQVSVKLDITLGSRLVKRLSYQLTGSGLDQQTSQLTYKVNRHTLNSFLVLTPLLSTFSELDFLTQYTYTYLQAYAQYWRFEVSLNGNGGTRLQKECLVQTLHLPIRTKGL